MRLLSQLFHMMKKTPKLKPLTEEQLTILQSNSLAVSHLLAEVAAMLKPGMTTLQIDAFCKKHILDLGGVPSFLGFHGYPFTICASVNDVVVHGFPNNRAMKEGDVISLDVGITRGGFVGEHAYTFVLGEASETVLKLVRVTKESLYKGVEKAIAGNRVGDIGWAVQEHTERRHGYGVVRDLVGHGLGRTMHEEPQVPNHGKRGSGIQLVENIVLAIEPMINLGKKDVYTESDGWTVRTRDRLPSVHFEHNVCVKKGKPWILSDFSMIEAAERNNPELNTAHYQSAAEAVAV